MPASASDTTLTFETLNTDTFATGAAIISNNDISSPPFQLNALNLQGTGAASGASGLTIQGNALQFSGANATVNLNALKGAGTGLTYVVSNNIALSSNTLFTGNGTVLTTNVGFNFAGTLSGTGSLTKTGSSTLTLGCSTVSNGLNSSFLYSGDINANAGTLGVIGNGNLYTKSKLTIGTGATFNVAGTTSIFSIFGTAGTLTGTAGSNSFLYINYTGTDPAAGFTGTISNAVDVAAAGSGNLTFGTIAGNTGSLSNAGTGTLTAVAIISATNDTGGARVWTPFATIKLTGNSGEVNGKGDTIITGTLAIAPSGSGSAVTVTGQNTLEAAAARARQFRYASGSTLQLNKGANTSVNFQIGNASSTSSDTQGILARNGMGTLILDPVSGAGTLGGAAKFTILNGATQANVLPMVSNGLANTAIVVVDNDGTRKADFVTYTGTGITSDIGFQQATYTLTDSFASSSNASVVKITSNQTISGATSAFALRNDATITISSGQTLTLGNPGTDASSAAATTAPQAGLILNGGSISGPGTLAFGNTEATIYTSTAGGTIGANMTGAGSYNFGAGATSGNVRVALNKFGAGTLYLTGTNSYSGVTVISAGALDVGGIAGTTLAGNNNTNLTFSGGVLQGSGTFIRGLGTGATQVTWNGINNSDSNVSGGFAARGGDLTVAIGGTGAPTALTWGNAPTAGNNFITEVAGDGGSTGVLIFGSNTSDSQVDFRNAIDLGSRVSPLYYRTIVVNQGTGTDSAKISGVISSTVTHGLIKDGSGKLILTGNNTYTGETIISQGMMIIDGNQSAATGALTANSGATLGGSGTIGGSATISAGGFLKPGNSSAGLLTINGPLTLGGNVEMEIATGIRGTNYDGVNIGASQLLTYGGTLTLTLTGSVSNGTYNLFSFTGGSNAGSFASIAFGGGYYTGTFSQAGDLWTSSLTQGQVFSFDQASGNLIAASPEPSTVLFLAFGLTVIVVMRRRKVVRKQ